MILQPLGRGNPYVFVPSQCPYYYSVNHIPSPSLSPSLSHSLPPPLSALSLSLHPLLGFGRKEVVEFLIERGAKIDIQDDGKKYQAGDREYGGERGERREIGRERGEEGDREYGGERGERRQKRKRWEWEIRHEREMIEDI